MNGFPLNPSPISYGMVYEANRHRPEAELQKVLRACEDRFAKTAMHKTARGVKST